MEVQDMLSMVLHKVLVFHMLITAFVLDSNNYYILTENPKITNITSNPVTANVPEFYYIMGTYLENPGSSNVTAYSSPDSWADIGNVSGQGYTTSNEQKDSKRSERSIPYSFNNELW